MVELYTSYLAQSILVIIWSIDIYSLVYKISATVHKVESTARLRFKSVHSCNYCHPGSYAMLSYLLLSISKPKFAYQLCQQLFSIGFRAGAHSAPTSTHT